MIPDRGYRVATRRLFVSCWVASFGLALLGGMFIRDRYTLAGGILVVMGIGCLRLAREVRDEMDRWSTNVSPPSRAMSVTMHGSRYEPDPQSGEWRQVTR